MRGRYHVGSKFTLSSDALENYGVQYANKVYTVRGRFDHYVNPSEMESDSTGHPGFDSGAGSPLYEADGLNFAVYEWEMVAA